MKHVSKRILSGLLVFAMVLSMGILQAIPTKAADLEPVTVGSTNWWPNGNSPATLDDGTLVEDTTSVGGTVAKVDMQKPADVWGMDFAKTNFAMGEGLGLPVGVVLYPSGEFVEFATFSADQLIADGQWHEYTIEDVVVPADTIHAFAAFRHVYFYNYGAYPNMEGFRGQTVDVTFTMKIEGDITFEESVPVYYFDQVTFTEATADEPDVPEVPVVPTISIDSTNWWQNGSTPASLENGYLVADETSVTGTVAKVDIQVPIDSWTEAMGEAWIMENFALGEGKDLPVGVTFAAGGSQEFGTIPVDQLKADGEWHNYTIKDVTVPADIHGLYMFRHPYYINYGAYQAFDELIGQTTDLTISMKIVGDITLAESVPVYYIDQVTFGPASEEEPDVPDVPDVPEYDGSDLDLTKMQIVLPADATTVEETAAEELKSYIHKITGATLSVVTEGENSGFGIYVGATDYAAAQSVTYTDNNGFGEGWAIKAVDGNLVLTGGETRGVLYAVYHLLEDVFGVRWWNLWEESVPTGNAIVPANYTDSGEPAFKYRDIYLSEKLTAENYARMRWNGQTTNIPAAFGGEEAFGPPYFNHTFILYVPPYHYDYPDSPYYQAINPNNTDYFVEHPEWFAWSDAKQARVGDQQLCLTNEELIAAITEMVITSVRFNKEQAEQNGTVPARYFALSPNDGAKLCECDVCTAQQEAKGNSGYLLTFVNQVAEAVAEVYPDVFIETLAYSTYVDAPLDDTRAADNVVVTLCTAMDMLHDMNHPNNATNKARIEAWNAIVAEGNFHIWDYVGNLTYNGICTSMMQYGVDFKAFHDLGMDGFFGEYDGCIKADFWDMKFWLMSKMLEDPDQTAEEYSALMNEFLNGYYGAGGTYVRQYLDYVDAKAEAYEGKIDLWGDIIHPEYLTVEDYIALDNYFEQAFAAVGSNETLLRRLRHARSGLDRVIIKNIDALTAEAEELNIEMTLDEKTVGKRLANTFTEQTELRGDWDKNGESLMIEFSKYLRNDVAENAIELDGAAFWYTPDPGAGNRVADADSITGFAGLIDSANSAVCGSEEAFQQYFAYGPGESFALTLYDTAGQPTVLGSIPFEDLKADGMYHEYRFEDFVITKDNFYYLWLFNGCYQHYGLPTELNKLVGETVDISIEMKITGDIIGTFEDSKPKYYISRFVIYLPAEEGGSQEVIDIMPGSAWWPNGNYPAEIGKGSVLDSDSAVGSAAIIDTNNFLFDWSESNLQKAFKVEPGKLVPVGVQFVSGGGEVLGYINTDDYILDGQYHEYFVRNVTIPEDSHGMYMFDPAYYYNYNAYNVFGDHVGEVVDIAISMKIVGDPTFSDPNNKPVYYIDLVTLYEHDPIAEYDEGHLTEISFIDDGFVPWSGAAGKLDEDSAVGGAIVCDIGKMFSDANYIEKWWAQNDPEDFIAFRYWMGTFDEANAPIYEDICRLKGTDIIADGEYHLYKFEDVVFVPENDIGGGYLAVCNDDTIQNYTLHKDYEHLKGQKVDFFVSLKVEGDITCSDPTNMPVYYFDRFIVVEHCEYSVDEFTSNGNGTCAAPGTKTGTCTVCGETVTVTDEDSLLNHSFTTKASDIKATDASCTAAATYYVQCDNCDAVSVSETVAVGGVSGHSFTDKPSASKIYDASCTVAAIHFIQCDNCEEVSTTRAILVGEPKGHNVVNGACTECDYEELFITKQPADVTKKLGTNAVFNVSATGEGLTYQWQYRTGSSGTWKNASATGNKTAKLTVPATASRDDYQYRCKVTDGAGNAVYTKVVTLNVFGITTQPKTVTQKLGAKAVFTVGVVGDGVTYQWQYRVGSNGTWKTASATGNKTAKLTVSATASRDGYQYRCKVTDGVGKIAYTNAATLNVFGITAQPKTVTQNVGTKAVFSVEVIGEDVTYQWQYRTSASGTWKNTTATGNKTANLTVPVTESRAGYQYRCVVKDQTGLVINSNIATLKVK